VIRYCESRLTPEASAKASILLEALPYLRRFSGKIVVVKVGGEILRDKEAVTALIEDLSLLHLNGIKILLCHGGGPQISEAMARLNLVPHFVDGQRVNDPETLEISANVLIGDVNRNLTNLLNVKAPIALGISGCSANILLCKERDPRLGAVGAIELVRTEPLLKMLDNGYIPVIASLGTDGCGRTFALNADIAAGELAGALRAEKLVILTNTEGIYEDPSLKTRLISEIDATSLISLGEKGAFTDGMLPKVESILTALSNGVMSAHVLNGRVNHVLLLEFFTRAGIGTMIYP
jgi:acetylglutamate kinase